MCLVLQRNDRNEIFFLIIFTTFYCDPESLGCASSPVVFYNIFARHIVLLSYLPSPHFFLIFSFIVTLGKMEL